MHPQPTTRAKSGPKVKPLEVRFWSKVDKNGPVPEHHPELGNCWVWTANTVRFGYGRIQIRKDGKGYGVRAHRVAFELTYGPIPDGMSVCHRCDNPPCVRPGHLFLGTMSDNTHDMITKGRRKLGTPPRGDRGRQAKLTWDIVREIRRRFANHTKSPRDPKTGRLLPDHTMKDAAQEYGVHTATLSKILLGQRWKE